jgi:hypothetical protein
MFVPNAKKLSQEGGMHKDIIMTSIRDCPTLTSNTNQEIVQMPLKTVLDVIIPLFQVHPNPGYMDKCVNIMQKTLHLDLLKIVAHL